MLGIQLHPHYPKSRPFFNIFKKILLLDTSVERMKAFNSIGSQWM